MRNVVHIISGIPGAGKTTVARMLAQRFERGVHIESDVLQHFIVAGGVWPDGGPTTPSTTRGSREEGARQLRLRCRNACLLASSFLEAGFTPVIDDVVIGSRLQDFRDDLGGRPIAFTLLVPCPEVVRERDAARADKHVFGKWGYLDRTMRTETPQIGLWLDSSAMTAQETADEIIRRVEEARID